MKYQPDWLHLTSIHGRFLASASDAEVHVNLVAKQEGSHEHKWRVSEETKVVTKWVFESMSSMFEATTPEEKTMPNTLSTLPEPIFGHEAAEHDRTQKLEYIVS